MQAERAYLISESWLLLISDFRYERRELELRLKELKSVLERLAIEDMQQHFAAVSAE
jgi:hypothetical protein